MIAPLVCCLLVALIDCQPFKPGYTYLEVFDPSQNSWVYSRLHYPENAKGQKFPIIVFSPGFLQRSTWYDYIWQELVPQGTIVAVMGTYDLNPDSFPIWKARDQAFLLQYLQNASKNDPHSPVYGILNDVAMASGHSEGGQASYIAGDPSLLDNKYTSRFNATLVLSGCWMGDQSDAVKALTNQKTPIFFITGSSDCFCPPPSYALPFFKSCTSQCKYIADIVDAGHCDFGWDGLGNVPCKLVGDALGCVDKWIITPEKQQRIVLSYFVPWVDWILKGNGEAKKQLDQLLKADQGRGVVSYQESC